MSITRFFKSTIVVALSVLTIFTSCKKENLNTNDSLIYSNTMVTGSPLVSYNSVNVQNVNGTLHFDCLDDFYMAEDLMGQYDDALDEFEDLENENEAFTVFEGRLNFNSYRAAVEQQQLSFETENEGNLDEVWGESPLANSPIFDEELASKLNTFQEVYIGCSYFRYFDDGHVVEIFNPETIQIAKARNMSSHNEAFDLGPNVISRKAGSGFNDQIIIRQIGSTNSFYLIPPHRGACDYQWLGEFVSTDCVPVVTINSNTEYTGHVNYRVNGKDYEFGYRIEADPCEDDSFVVQVSQENKCGLLNFTPSLPAVPDQLLVGIIFNDGIGNNHLFENPDQVYFMGSRTN